MGINRYIFVTNPNFWDKLRNHPMKLWPIKSRYISMLNLNINDEILVYLSKKGCIAGVLEVTGRLQEELNSFENGKYEFSLPVTYKVTLNEENMIPLKTLVEYLDYTKRKKSNWGPRFQRAVVRINENDFNFIRSKVCKSNQAYVDENSIRQISL